MKIAFLFPGQGSQKVGMGKDLYEKYGITSQNETLEEIIEKYSANHYHTRKR